MKTFVLILTIFGSEGSAAIDHVPGFKTRAVCEAAGRAWDKGIRSGYFSSRTTSFVCVEADPQVEK